MSFTVYFFLSLLWGNGAIYRSHKPPLKQEDVYATWPAGVRLGPLVADTRHAVGFVEVAVGLAHCPRPLWASLSSIK